MEQVRDLLRSRPAGHTIRDGIVPIDANVRLMSDDRWIDIQFSDQGLTLEGRNNQPLDFAQPELVVYFSSPQTALRILQGELPLVDAVMQGHVRSSGYIVWVFRLLRALLPS